MPFDELVRTRRMEDPDEREVQDIKKSSKKYRSHVRRKSISTNSAAGILFVLKLVAAVVLVVLLLFFLVLRHTLDLTASFHLCHTQTSHQHHYVLVMFGKI